MPTEDELAAQLKRLDLALNARTARAERLVPYDESGAPIPTAVVQAKLTKAYKVLLPASEAPWGSLVVDSVQDRLEVAGVRDDNEDTAKRAWAIWQNNQMDSESKLAHRAALRDGRAFALVWPGPDGPEITLDDATQMVVEYREGSRRHRVAAMRRWVADGRVNATLYRPDGIYKFGRAENAERWERREVPGERWPLENPFGSVVPVVELAVNRRLAPGSFGYARGEFEHCTGLIDRINLLTFLGMVVALWMGFPLRGVTGDAILRDDDGNPLPPFESRPDSVVQFENPNAKVFQLPAADRKNLSVFAELDQLAVVTKTPRHYFPLEQGMSNLSADAIRASEGGLHAKVTGHKASLGEGWEEVLRLAVRAEDGSVLSPGATLRWNDHESRSLAERADAAAKLKDLLPWQAVAERVLNASQDDLARWEAQRGADALNTLMAGAAAPSPPPVPEPVTA